VNQYRSLPVQAFTTGFGTGCAHAQRYVQDLSTVLAPVALSEYGLERRGDWFGQHQGGRHGTARAVRHRAA
jgi:hypothetical protein